MNTSLKNARIFDEDSWEWKQNVKNLTIKKEIKIEPEDCTSDNARFEIISKTNHANDSNNTTSCNVKKYIKQESNRNDTMTKLDCDNTNDSTDSASNQSRKSTKRTVYKREGPYTRHESTMCVNNKTKEPNEGVWIQLSKYEYETNPEILMRRQKQIDFGKNTIGYDNYILKVPRDKRTNEDPSTPNKNLKYSRRAWDGLIRQWRVRLHKYD